MVWSYPPQTSSGLAAALWVASGRKYIQPQAWMTDWLSEWQAKQGPGLNLCFMFYEWVGTPSNWDSYYIILFSCNFVCFYLDCKYFSNFTNETECSILKVCPHMFLFILWLLVSRDSWFMCDDPFSYDQGHFFILNGVLDSGNINASLCFHVASEKTSQ